MTRTARPVLVTNLYQPALRAGFVARRRLTVLLIAGRDRGLTVVRAPAGFGKTTLVGDWLADDPRLVAWLSLDEDENDPDRFLACLVAAFQTAAPNLGAELQASLGSGQSPHLPVALTWMLNDLAAPL